MILHAIKAHDREKAVWDQEKIEIRGECDVAIAQTKKKYLDLEEELVCIVLILIFVSILKNIFNKGLCEN